LWLLESITNPLLTVPDLAACVAAGHQTGALVAVDNTFPTPLTLRPLDLGADVVIHSLSKYAGGHSDLVLGSATVRDPALGERLVSWRTATGAIPGQLETWLCLRGLRTLDVRLRRQMGSAAVLADRLSDHGAVERVHYPGLASHPHHDRAAAQLRGGFGAVVSFETTGGAARAEAVCTATRLWAHATSLGAVESTLERRARYELDAEVVPESLIRLSVGIEDVEDLWQDLDQALDLAAG
jgi:cystathionine gamma-synthase